jgi:hypothetical protein
MNIEVNGNDGELKRYSVAFYCGLHNLFTSIKNATTNHLSIK